MWTIIDPASGLARPFRFRNYHRPPLGRDEDGLRHIWYSKQQARLTEIIARYRLLDYDVIVDVTTASESPDHGCFWDDMQYLGQGWYVNSYDNPNHHLRGFDSSYNSINPCREVQLPIMSSYNDSYQAAGQIIGADYGHAGIDEPELITHPDNPTFSLNHITERHLREIWNP